MPTPVFELIMQDIEAQLEAIPALSGKVSRGEPFTIDTWPFAHLARGSLDPDPEFGPNTHLVTMEFSLTLGTSVNPPANLETALADLVGEVFAKLYEDPRLGGLGDLTWLGDDAVTVGDEEGHGREIQSASTWQVIYATVFGDPYTAYTT